MTTRDAYLRDLAIAEKTGVFPVKPIDETGCSFRDCPNGAVCYGVGHDRRLMPVLVYPGGEEEVAFCRDHLAAWHRGELGPQ